MSNPGARINLSRESMENLMRVPKEVTRVPKDAQMSRKSKALIASGPLSAQSKKRRLTQS